MIGRQSARYEVQSTRNTAWIDLSTGRNYPSGHGFFVRDLSVTCSTVVGPPCPHFSNFQLCMLVGTITLCTSLLHLTSTPTARHHAMTDLPFPTSNPNSQLDWKTKPAVVDHGACACANRGTIIAQRPHPPEVVGPKLATAT